MSQIDRVHARQILDSRGNPTVEVDQRAVEARLVETVEPGDRLGDLGVDVADGLRHPLAAPRRAAVAQLGRLELARRGAGGHRGAPLGAGAQHQVDLDGRVAARVEDLARMERLDLAQGWVSSFKRARA